MGCCISKCNPNPKTRFNSEVQDKLVITQSPQSTPPRKLKTVQSPPSITSGSLTCSTQSSTCGSSLSSVSFSSSSSYSVVFPKVDHSFSRDFLQSCAMENPQIVGLDTTKKIEAVKQSSPASTQKRARASSPNLTRQKSFRVEKEARNVVNGRSFMGSPSPSRQFVGYASNYQRQTTSLSMKTHNESNYTVKSNTRQASPNRNMICKGRPVYLKKKLERFGYEVGAKVEVGQVLSKVKYSGAVPMEDLDNPHIALDCFIFL